MAKNLCKILEKEGFSFIRQTGSHKIYQKQTQTGTITIPIPFSTNKPIKKGTLINILKKIGISKERLSYLLSVFILS